MNPPAAPAQSSAPASPPAAPTAPAYDGKGDSTKGEKYPEIDSTKLDFDVALKMYKDARTYVDSSFRVDWDNYFKVYKRQRVNRHYEGISDPVVPEAFTIIETLVANIAGGNIHFHFVKANEEQTNDTDVLNNLLDYWLACENFALKNQEWVRDMLLYGTGILHITWSHGRPKIDNIPLRDFFVSPTATMLGNAEYAGFEYLAEKADLENQTVYNPDTDTFDQRYSNLEECVYTGQRDSNGQPMDKEFKDQFNGSTLTQEAYKTQIHVIRLYHIPSGAMIEIGNKKTFILYVDTPFQREEKSREETMYVPDPDTGVTKPQTITRKLDAIRPFLPFAVVRDYVDTSLFFGEGEMATMADRAEMLNDLEAMDTDNLAYQNTPMYQIDPQFADLAPEIETIPGAVYPIPKGAISAMPIAEISGNLDVKKDRVADQMRRVTAADETVQGVSQEQGRITATEVSSQLNQAQNRFSTKISNLESEGYAQLGIVLYKLAQIFVDTGTAVRIVGKMGVYFKDYDPWEYNGEMEPHVELDSTQRQKQLEVGQKDNQLFQMLEASPVYDPVEVQRFIVQHISPDISDEAFNKMLAKAPTGPSPEEMKLQAASEAARYSALATIYGNVNTTPFIRAQIEVKFQLHPDPVHEVEQQTAAMEHGARQHIANDPTTDNTGKPLPPVPVAAPDGLTGGATDGTDQTS